ncbi:Iqg1 protein [Saccharomycopsis crataegensis]|uniref:Iqg1 protein n=1 Tax=Saccharomycopsis crataegensis TaxID=43959 RepID=A0AAV5QVE3_9ASCO|nr:Iqg1 protein [Saccharomycopsis crataegensis]
MARGNIANRYLQNIEGGSTTATSASNNFASRIFSSSPLRENKNVANSGRITSLKSNLPTPRNNLLKEEEPSDVTGLRGRKKFTKKASDENLNASWFDNQRQSLQGYEYLCRVGEAKRWIENCIEEELPSEAELCNDGFRDGVILAKLTRAFVPELVRKIIPSSKKLQFRHTENINNFFQFLDIVEIPELFRFELTDLYDKKNIPKVIFCIHALSFLLAQDEKAPQMTELVGKLEFTDEEISASQKALNGAHLPNFNSVKKEQSNETSVRSNSPNKGLSFRNKSFIDYDDENYNSRAPASPKRKSVPLSVTKKVESEPESEDPEPTNEELELVLKSVIRFQSLARGSIFRYRMFVQKMVLKANEEYLRDIQSIFRAKKFRNGPFIKESKIQKTTPSVIELQSFIRGAMTRKVLRHSVKKIHRKNIDHIVVFQSCIRGTLLRSHLLTQLDDLGCTESLESIIKLQSVIRRVLYKRLFEKNIREAFGSATSLIELQSVIRGGLIRKDLVHCLKTLDFTSSSITKLQAMIRRKIFSQKHQSNLKNLADASSSIIAFQSKVRMILYEKKFRKMLQYLNNCRSPITELQAISRGGASRIKLNATLDTLDLCENKASKLTAIIRGNQTRDSVNSFKARLRKEGSEDITYIQAAIRGLLARFGQDMFLDELEDHETSIISVQSKIRGNLKRDADRKRDEYYLANVDKVIKIQSLIKGKDFTDAYKKLLTMSNPPIGVIAKFAHLLNDTDKDFQDEIYFNQLNAKIVHKTKETEMLEQTNKELDIKIALLVKNKITLDELVRQRNNGYQGYKVDLDPNLGNLDINSLNKITRVRIEIHQKLFYLLQTEPKYFINIVNKYEFGKGDNQHLKEIQLNILKVFNHGGCGLGYASARSMSPKRRGSPTRKSTDEYKGVFKREEFLFMRFLTDMIKFDIENSTSINDFANRYIENSGTMWQKLFNSFIRTPKQKNILKNLFGSLISSVADIENLSLESDPLKIYQSILEDEDKPVHTRITVEEAIQKPEVRNQFVKNLAQLRELSNSFFELIWEKIDILPLFLKVMMSSMFFSLKSKFQDTISEKLILSICGYILVDLYLNSIVVSPENYGITLTTLNTSTTLKFKGNLHKIAKLLGQMTLMVPFSIEEVYLQPLNEYIESQSVLVEKILKRLTIKSNCNIEKLYEMSVLDDLSLYKKPTLLIEVEDLSKITSLISNNSDLLSPKEDLMNKYLSELDEVSKQSHKSLKHLIGAKEFRLTLDPVIKDMESEYNGSKKNALLIQAKRCVIYMLQVQGGRNLLDLLLSKIGPVDEKKFAQIIHNEAKEKSEKNIYTNASQGSLGDLLKMSYHDLKCLALEKILELESMGILERENNFQQLINEIAYDIRAKKHQRLSKKEQIKGAEKVLKGIEDKEKRLKKILDVYNDSISKAMASLQSQPTQSKKKLFPFFSKQYFYQRELRRQGKTPKFGSYKYSAKYLSDQGILGELKGVKCGVIGLELPKVDFMFSCDEVGVFLIEAASGSVPIPDAIAKLSLDDLLLFQYENKDFVEIYDGIVKFNTDTFLNFIFKKFYDNSG